MTCRGCHLALRLLAPAAIALCQRLKFFSLPAAHFSLLFSPFSLSLFLSSYCHCRCDFETYCWWSMTCSGTSVLPHVRMITVVKCCEILEKLSSEDDGIKFFVGEEKAQLDLEPIIVNLFALQHKANSAPNFRRPALRALLGICRFEAGLVKKAVLTANGVSLVLRLLDDSDSEIWETAINFVFPILSARATRVMEILMEET
ncbi:hypothetical protein CJ030_MR3G009421 [Morella rubra]|uniref:Uncharacterized protein n=1 Tax=Morella rubra TaxID=262757 RepID=A0A6A1W5T3_9ROSI|nr:hypothetical protein CJ030_MR3G009421 [Morella rubra]